VTNASIEQAAREQYNAVSDSFYSQASIITLINKAQQELATKALLIENKTTFATVAGTRAYSYPSNVIAFKRVEYSGAKLDPIDFRDDDLVNLYPTTTTTGTPRFYSIWDKQIYLRPIPAAVATVTVYVYSEPTIMTLSTETPEVPTQFHLGLTDYILMHMAAKDGNLQLASWHQNIWEKFVKDAIRWKQKEKVTDGFRAVKSEDLARKTVLGVK
jgi:hypothetical protein